MKLKRTSLLTKLLILALLVYMTTSLLNLNGRSQECQAQLDQLTSQAEDLRRENSELEEAIEHSDDPAMLEQVARDKGYVKEGETLFIDVAN